ncbi:MAG: hypothetical protein IIW92_08815 [Lachnospiraceae bacterium]|nr:hypothetical protein [Lachnospiraceae bacterium]MEE0862227.1 hypothetical protein [Lachnospiraceae bacterium]
MVALIPKSKRDKRRSTEQQLHKEANSNFANELDKAMDEYNYEDFQTLTYNAHSQLEPFIYVKHKEYTV